MWMNDYEYEFKKDGADKKNIARSARSIRTHCGKRGAVRLPSDNLTKKELKAMNGEVINYASLKKPMSFEEFKKLPNDLKKRYITWIREKFEVPDKYIAEMMHVSCKYLSLFLVELELNKGAGFGKRNWKKNEFYAWISGADMDAAVAPVETEPVAESGTETEAETETTEQDTTTNVTSLSDEAIEDNSKTFSVDNRPVKPVKSVPVSGRMTFEGTIESILATLGCLLGGENVMMTVSWVINKD